MSVDLPFKAKRAILAFFTVWLLLVLAAPLLLPPGSVTDLSGRSGTIDNADVVGEMNPLSAAIYMIGDGNCHQLADRSFFLNGNQMPFCSRDIGIFLGLVAGMAVVIVLSPRFSWLALIVLALPIVIDGGVQYIGMWESNNLLRVVTGILGGVAVSYFLGHVADTILVEKENVKKTT